MKLYYLLLLIQFPFIAGAQIKPVMGKSPVRQKWVREEIAIYDYQSADKKGILSTRITLVEKGVYQSQASGDHPVWKVTVQDNIGGMTNSSTYYIDRKTRQLWQQEINAVSRKIWLKSIEE